MSKLTEWFRARMRTNAQSPVPMPHNTASQPVPRKLPSYSIDSLRSVIEVQQLLTGLGYLDPPADGGWGPVSRLALAELCKRTGNVPVDPNALHLTPFVIGALKASQPLPINLTRNDLATKIVKLAMRKGMFLCRLPNAVNIFYVEGMDPNGALNSNATNEFRDIRCPIVFDDLGFPRFAGGPWVATTEPGKYFTDHAVNPGGAFHIDLAIQFKAWQVGIYHTREALLQRGTISGTRDRQKLYRRDPCYPDKGANFGVHHHDGYNLAQGDIGKSSAGCLVGRSVEEHKLFIGYCKRDPRYVVNHSYMFMAAVLDGKEVV